MEHNDWRSIELSHNLNIKCVNVQMCKGKSEDVKKIKLKLKLYGHGHINQRAASIQ